ncbi:FYVE, RhoGEF and PH domain-containing protein 5-like isoform X1 [Mizuhopecten yessoensis]|uniref:FYVE, RhoGEF and PH domain-containing protein 5-like isoform X1 n=1 Tax=Mizuhopecten yessoensis TaxID=6573 RepID=UPI000B4594BE|nr:FYVE, RhoGEF and PH domain-containing protein 5-like isoform X1 [Mizuhopecten yessoensis]
MLKISTFLVAQSFCPDGDLKQGQEFGRNSVQRKDGSVKRPIPAGGKPKPQIAKKPSVSNKPARLLSQTSVDTFEGNNSTEHVFNPQLHEHKQAPGQTQNETKVHNSRDPSITKHAIPTVPVTPLPPSAQYNSTGFDDVIDGARGLLTQEADPVLQSDSHGSSTYGFCSKTLQVQGHDLEVNLQNNVNVSSQEAYSRHGSSNHIPNQTRPCFDVKSNNEETNLSRKSSRKPPSVSPKPRKGSLAPENKQSTFGREEEVMDISPSSGSKLSTEALQEQDKGNSSSGSVLSKVSIFSEQISQQQTTSKTSVSRSWTLNSAEKKSLITRSYKTDTDGELSVKPSGVDIGTPVKEDSSNLPRSKSTVTMRPKPSPRVSPKGVKPVPIPRKRLSLEQKTAAEIMDRRIEESDSNCTVTSSTSSMTSSMTSSISSMTSSMTSSFQNGESGDFTNRLQAETELGKLDLYDKYTTPPPDIPKKQNGEEVKFRFDDLNKVNAEDDTSSLLNDIAKLINEAFDVSPKPRPVSLDASPVRPPRRKRQCCNPDSMEYNSDSEFSVLKKDSHKGSTQSLNALELSSVSSSNRKPCPPKPIRKKLANGKTNRSQSDLGDIRQLVLMKESAMKLNRQVKMDSPSDRSTVPQMRDKSNVQIVSNRGNSCILTPDTRVPPNQEAIIREKLKERSKSLPGSRNKGRPKRPAPPPPVPGTKVLSVGNKLMSVNSLDDDNPYYEIPDMSRIERTRASSLQTTFSSEGKFIPPQLPPRNESKNMSASHISRVSPASSRALDFDRPISLISNQSDSGSISQGSPAQGSSSSEDESLDQETRKERKRLKKIRFIAREIASSEKVFVDVLKLLNIDFRLHISKAEEEAGKTIVPKEYMDKILSHLPQLQNFNEVLLKDMQARIEKWDENPTISDIFVKKGPFLMLYTSYIQDFSDMTAILDEALKKLPLFQSVVKEFEMSPRCACLAIRQHMLKPIQRIPQYKMLLQDYLKHLTPDSPDYNNTQEALVIVSAVADHANDSMKQGDQVQRMLEIQKSLDGNFEVIRPGRLFIKAGELMKWSRKEMQERMFFLFSDVLLYTTPTATGGYRLNQVLTLTGMKVSMSTHDEFSNEFNIISTHKSFTVEAKTQSDRNAWLAALQQAVEENAKKRNTFEKVEVLDHDFKKGDEAPVWIPDTRVTMCMICTSEFSVIHRRHHCRACGKVLCSYCSMNKVPLKYLNGKEGRVCNECYDELKPEYIDDEEVEIQDQQKSPFDFIAGKLFRKSNNKPHRPKRFQEVHANDQGSQMSGYLKVLQQKGRWKKYWHVLKDKVLYTYRASEDTAAVEIKPIVGYEVAGFEEIFEGIHQSVLFQLKHQNQKPIIFQGENASITERWIKVMKEASVP